MLKQQPYLIISILALSSCGMLQKTAKKEFNDGYYSQKIDGKKERVYLNIVDETIQIHRTKLQDGKRIIDTLQNPKLIIKEMKYEGNQTISFGKPSFDIDFLTIPLKYRSPANNIPSQLNANLNGAVYFGYRYDKYVLNHISNPLGKSERNINHFGFSFGGFTGIGNTFMSPTNTNNILQQEYDGIVWSKGISGIFAVNNFTVGVALGFDNLLDKNKTSWLYQNKPWFGLAFGLNLN